MKISQKEMKKLTPHPQVFSSHQISRRKKSLTMMDGVLGRGRVLKPHNTLLEGTMLELDNFRIWYKKSLLIVYGQLFHEKHSNFLRSHWDLVKVFLVE